MKLIQFVLLAFVLFAIMRVIQRYRQHGMRLLEFLFWTLIWVGAAITVTFPETTQFLADLLGIGRGTDLILYIGLTATFYLILRIHLTLDHLEQEVTEVVRVIALESLKAPGQPGSAETRGAKES